MSDCLFATFAAQFSKLTSQFGTNIINLIILSVHSILLSILMLCLFLSLEFSAKAVKKHYYLLSVKNEK